MLRQINIKMISKSAFRRLSFAFTLLTFFCVLPYDWSKKERLFKKPRYKLKQLIHMLIGCLALAVGLVPTISFTFDMYYDSFSGTTQFFMISMVVILAIVVSLLGLGIWIDGAKMVSLANNVLRYDQYLKGSVLTKQEIKTLQHRTSLVVVSSNLIEPFSLIHTFALAMFFFEDYDPYNRYFYRHVKWIFGLNSFWWDMMFLAGYMVVIRLMYGFLVTVVLLISLYLESTSYWLGHMSNKARPFQNSLKSRGEVSIDSSNLVISLKRFYNTQFLLANLTNTSVFVKVFLPILLFFGFVAVVIQMYVTITQFGVISLGPFIFFPSMAAILLIFLRAWFNECGKIQSNSETFIQAWKAEFGHDKEFIKYLVSCQSLKLKIGGFFQLNGETFLLFLQQLIDKTVGLILY